MAQLKTENRTIEDQLVQEETDNGELTARLDDARHQLSQRGVDFDAQSSSTTSRDLDGGPDAKITIPAGQSNRKRRKPPFTQIPGRNRDHPADRARRRRARDRSQADPG